MNQRADNKVKLNMYLDSNLKDAFKKLTEANKTCMTDVLLQTIQNYIKEHEQTLKAK